MQKVYLLLRNNRQTGPYSLEELVQMGLKPFDLIWVEGKSFGWSYPAEIEQLKPYVDEPQVQPLLSSRREELIDSHSFMDDKEHPATTKISPKNIFVSLPAGKKISAEKGQIASDILEQKAEELRKRAQAYASQKENIDHPALETKYVRSLADAEEDFTSWVYAQKVVKKKAPIKKYATPIATLLFVIAIAVTLTMTVFRSKPVSVSATPVIMQANTAEVVLPDSNHTNKNANETVAKNQDDGKIAGNVKNESATVSQEMRPSIASKPTQKVLVSNNKSESSESAPSRVIADSSEMIGVTEQKQVDIAEPEKKKKIGQKIEGFFDNLKNKKEERKAASVLNDVDERNAVRRSENGAATVDLTESVTVTANERANDWMMGIQGLKLTLRNNSNHTLKSAEVEVKYFNEDKSLLEKKTIRFSDIPPRKAVSLPAPDHRMADHVDFQVVSAKGIENENIR